MTDPVWTVLILLVLLTIKHMLADFALQSAYILKHRKTYGHPAGLLHVGIHIAGTLPILLAFGTSPFLAAQLILFEAVVHYHVDWAKDNVIHALKMSHGQRKFWIALGFDQMLHQLTYIAMAAWWYAAS